MSQYEVPNPEDKVVCPYDNVHVIFHKKMQYHLVKCRKNHDTSEKAACPFNRRHEVPKLELRYHMSVCPDKIYIEQDFYQTIENDYRGNLSIPPSDISKFLPKSKETWEDEGNVLPHIKINEPEEFRNLTGLKPAERRNYKKLLREKFEMKVNSESKSNSEPIVKNEETLSEGLQPLRKPKTNINEHKTTHSIGRGRGCFKYSDVTNTFHHSKQNVSQSLSFCNQNPYKEMQNLLEDLK